MMVFVIAHVVVDSMEFRDGNDETPKGSLIFESIRNRFATRFLT